MNDDAVQTFAGLSSPEMVSGRPYVLVEGLVRGLGSFLFHDTRNSAYQLYDAQYSLQLGPTNAHSMEGIYVSNVGRGNSVPFIHV